MGDQVAAVQPVGGMLLDRDLGPAGQARRLRLAAIGLAVDAQRVERDRAELLAVRLLGEPAGIFVHLDLIEGMIVLGLGHRLERTFGFLEVEIADRDLGLAAGGDPLHP